MPDALIPNGSNGSRSFYSGEETEVFRLSSKSHWDLPIDVEGEIVHLLLSHPTPPVFDGSEDRNGRRNHDEIRLWADYLTPDKSGYLYDDSGLVGGLPEGARFVILGDLNADPNDGDSVRGAAQQLLENPRIDTHFTPSSEGGKEAADASHLGDPSHDTADFGSGNLRVDYALPSKAGWDVKASYVYWPKRSEPASAVVRGASDHRMVYLDLEITPLSTPQPVTDLTIRRDGESINLQWKRLPNYDYRVLWTTELGKPWIADQQLTVSGDQAQAEALDATVKDAKRKYYKIEVGEW